jgi:hypothetical protein
MQNSFQTLIDFLSKEVGADIEVGNDTRVFCNFDEFPVLIEYLEGADQILLAVSIAPVPDQNREAFYRTLLQGQYLFYKTGGATLALGNESNFVNLQVLKDLCALTPQNFLTLMENFLHVAGYWQTICAEAAQNAGENKTQSTGPEPAEPQNQNMIRI